MKTPNISFYYDLKGDKMVFYHDIYAHGQPNNTDALKLGLVAEMKLVDEITERLETKQFKGEEIERYTKMRENLKLKLSKVVETVRDKLTETEINKMKVVSFKHYAKILRKNDE